MEIENIYTSTNNNIFLYQTCIFRCALVPHTSVMDVWFRDLSIILCLDIVFWVQFRGMRLSVSLYGVVPLPIVKAVIYIAYSRPLLEDTTTSLWQSLFSSIAVWHRCPIYKSPDLGRPSCHPPLNSVRMSLGFAPHSPCQEYPHIIGRLALCMPCGGV